MHTEMEIDNQLNTVHIKCCFVGRSKDARMYQMMIDIGDGETIDIPSNWVFLLADGIYPSGHPLVTPYSSTQI